MRMYGNVVAPHSGLIPSETLYEERWGLLWPIVRKRNFIITYVRLLSLPFLYVIWSTSTNISPLFKNRSIIFLKNLTIPRLIINLHLRQVSRTLNTKKVIKWGFKCQKLFPRFCVYKWASLIIHHWYCFEMKPYFH